MVWVFCPANSAKRDATLKYWNALNTIAKEADSVEKKPSPNAESAVEALAPVREAGAKCSKGKNDLINLSVFNVDPELLELGRQIVEMCQKMETAVLKLDVVAQEVDAEAKNRKSWGYFWKDFFRGFTLDYKSSFDETDKVRASLKAKIDSILDELVQIKAEGDRIDSALLSLRSTLSQRYGVDFAQ